MLVKIKTAEELALMRESGRLLAQVFAMLDDYVKAGISTMDINNRVEDFIVGRRLYRQRSAGATGQQGAVRFSLCAESIGESCGLPRHAQSQPAAAQR